MTNLGGMLTCAHCRRELAGVATIFPATPAVCGRADCLLWARSAAAQIEVPGGDLHPHGGVNGQLIDLGEARAAVEARPAAA